jgi:hypothetical protein
MAGVDRGLGGGEYERATIGGGTAVDRWERAIDLADRALGVMRRDERADAPGAGLGVAGEIG